MGALAGGGIFLLSYLAHLAYQAWHAPEQIAAQEQADNYKKIQDLLNENGMLRRRINEIERATLSCTAHLRPPPADPFAMAEGVNPRLVFRADNNTNAHGTDKLLEIEVSNSGPREHFSAELVRLRRNGAVVALPASTALRWAQTEDASLAIADRAEVLVCLVPFFGAGHSGGVVLLHPGRHQTVLQIDSVARDYVEFWIEGDLEIWVRLSGHASGRQRELRFRLYAYQEGEAWNYPELEDITP